MKAPSQRGIIRALHVGGAEGGKLGRFLDRLPNNSELLSALPIEFESARKRIVAKLKKTG